MFSVFFSYSISLISEPLILLFGFLILKYCFGVPVMAQQKRIWVVTMRTQVQFLASLNGLRIWCCWELWCRPAATAGVGHRRRWYLVLLWLWCRPSAIAVTAATALLDPWPGNLYMPCCGPKKTKKKNHSIKYRWRSKGISNKLSLFYWWQWGM